jgi:rod shape-determining protein MreD
VAFWAASSEKSEVYRFPFAAILVVSFLALTLQSYLPLHLNFVRLLDLPLLVVIYFSLTRRNPVEAMLVGALIGMGQDSLTRGPIGLFGAVKTVIGYVTSSLSLHVDTESIAVRLLTCFVLYGLHSILYYFVGAILLGQPIDWDSQARLIGALANALAGVLLFKVLDRFRRPA